MNWKASVWRSRLWRCLQLRIKVRSQRFWFQQSSCFLFNSGHITRFKCSTVKVVSWNNVNVSSRKDYKLMPTWLTNWVTDKIKIQNVTFHGKTYTNDFPFSNGIPFTSRLEVVRKKFASVRTTWVTRSKKVCIRSNGLITRSVETSNRSNDLDTRLV